MCFDSEIKEQSPFDAPGGKLLVWRQLTQTLLVKKGNEMLLSGE